MMVRSLLAAFLTVSPAAPRQQPQQSTPPSAAPSPAAKPPAAPAASPRLLDPAVFARGTDSLSDVKAVTRTIVRCTAPVLGVTVDLGPLPGGLEQRPADGAIEFWSREGTGPSALLGSFRCRGPSVEWCWHRASTKAHARALERLDALLPGATLDVALEGGGRERLCAAPASVRLSLAAGVPEKVRVAGPGGRPVRVELEGSPDGGWQPDPGEEAGPGVVLLSESGEIRVAWDAAAGELQGEWHFGQALELKALRAELAERRRESRQRSGEEQRIIAMEITALERRIAEIAASAGSDPASQGEVPRLRLVGGDGRVYATVAVQVGRKEGR